jgi:hypothetical protein
MGGRDPGALPAINFTIAGLVLGFKYKPGLIFPILFSPSNTYFSLGCGPRSRGVVGWAGKQLFAFHLSQGTFSSIMLKEV